MTLIRPGTVAEALAALARTPMPLIAGGTDFYPSRQGRPLPDNALDLTGIAGLRGIGHDGDGWRIGAATTWTDIAMADLPPAFDALRAAAREVGSVQIQNAGTIAGNLCNASPAADGVPPLLALDAVVECVSAAGIRRLALADFLLGPRKTALGPAEIVTALLFSDPPATERATFLKLGSRRYLVISIAMVAANVSTDAEGRVQTARIAVGACSPVARRLPAVEAALLGRDLHKGPDSFEITPEMLSPLSPIDDVRAPARYRMEAVNEMIVRALGKIMESPHG
ncbi:xanthine dehydrogenase family protein subunit M [Defluviimonas sp. WL0002]|uniref:Xanthine dehydrogenase family protein subunit M n=1 Tax=Albidovulum marisflavi TaxID=2984159 RepID=A0ABT2ZA98_9RHOB|nr:xanthine dehydrogenase family protein subunit M [Defluviimonas sp. WL0002]MCV2868008.1 xanthine dehydrogenase family protein subunit M [Defluviimonas sp. WL0002]